jgi:hypothetical protein
MDQGDISRLEARTTFDDCQVSTLQRYLAAIGGRLELVAAFGDKKIIISGVEATAAAGTSAKAVAPVGPAEGTPAYHRAAGRVRRTRR